MTPPARAPKAHTFWASSTNFFTFERSKPADIVRVGRGNGCGRPCRVPHCRRAAHEPAARRHLHAELATRASSAADPSALAESRWRLTDSSTIASLGVQELLQVLARCPCLAPPPMSRVASPLRALPRLKLERAHAFPRFRLRTRGAARRFSGRIIPLLLPLRALQTRCGKTPSTTAVCSNSVCSRCAPSVSVRSLVWLAGTVPAIWRRICRLLASEPFKRAEASFVQVRSRLRQVIKRQQDNARVPGRNSAARLESAQSCCARLCE